MATNRQDYMRDYMRRWRRGQAGGERLKKRGWTEEALTEPYAMRKERLRRERDLQDGEA